MNKVKLIIDNKEVFAEEGEYILNVARANDIFIPAICYLTRCSPTLACRLCIVDVDGKRAYACNAKAKEGIEVVVNSQELADERRAIMEIYDINHPLQCGECDQSGECELQNYTLDMGVFSQNYAIKDTKRDTKNWGLITYDPALCIVCERCITACKDMIGDVALKTIPRGGEALAKELKDTMPKDAYAMWGKMQKSIIGTTNPNGLDCSFCGECVAVCPVGALVSKDFKYTSNAWELKQISSTCGYCSSGCHLYYDYKHTSTEDNNQKIYRVKNDWQFVSLCGAGRFGFETEEDTIQENLENSKAIIFDSFITNEEALFLENLRQKFGCILVNQDAFLYQKFLQNFSKGSGKNLYSGNLEDIHNSEFIICIGTNIVSDNPRVRYAINNSLIMNKGSLAIYAHPVIDNLLKWKNISHLEYKPLEEVEVLKAIIKGYCDFEIEANMELVAKLSSQKKNRILIIGSDFYGHPDSENLAKLIGFIERNCGFKVILIPSCTNTLGVSLLCTLTQSKDGTRYKSTHFTKQSGTITNIDKRVVPLYGNNIDKISYTPKLPKEKGYKEGFLFHNLESFYTNEGEERRGYLLDIFDTTIEDSFSINSQELLKGDIGYGLNPILQFNEFTQKSKLIKDTIKCFAGLDTMKRINKKDGDILKFKIKDILYQLPIFEEKRLSGDFIFIPTNVAPFGDIFKSCYRFVELELKE